MSGTAPQRTFGFQLNWLTIGFCRALVAYDSWARTAPASLTPLQKQNYAVAQDLFWRLGLDPTPHVPLDAAAKAGIVALLQIRRGFSDAWAAKYQAEIRSGTSMGWAATTADRTVPDDAAIRAQVTSGAAKDGLTWLVNAFSPYDKNGKMTSQIGVYTKRIALARPPNTALGNCTSLAQVAGVLQAEAEAANAADRAAGLDPPDLDTVEMLPVENATFESYTQDRADMRAGRRSAIYTAAPAHPAGAALNIYGAAPIQQNDFAGQDASNLDHTFTPFDDPNAP